MFQTIAADFARLEADTTAEAGFRVQGCLEDHGA